MPFLAWGPTSGNQPLPLSVANGGTGASTAAGAAAALGVAPWWSPADDGFLGFNSDPAGGSGGGLLIAGTLYLARLPIRTSQLVSNIWVCPTVAGAGASTGSFVFLVSGATGAVLAQSADAATFFTGTGWQKVPMTVPATTGGAGAFPYAAILTNLATTQPTFLRQLNTVNDSPQATVNLASARWAQQVAFGTAVGAVTLASNAASAFSNVVGWS
jgi:hypothetical protein